MTPLLPLGIFTGWLASGERGLSSEAIVAHLTGQAVGRWRGAGSCGGSPHYPHDPSDFRRCELLLRAVPLARLALPEMRSASPTWAALVDHWTEIVALCEQEIPGCFDSSHSDGPAPRAYALIKQLCGVA